MPRPGIEVDAFLRSLPDLRVSSDAGLPTERSCCPKCNRRRLWFCGDCLEVLGDKSKVPDVALPIDVDIVHHPAEKLSKSTAPHAALVSSQIRLLDFPDVPDYDPASTLLLYPCATALPIQEVDLRNFSKVVFVDCTWTQAPAIMAHPNMASLTPVKIEKETTAFWRVQRVGDDHLATVEAVYYFFVQHFKSHNEGAYDHRYDDLLFYFKHQHSKFIESQRPQMEAYKKTEEYRKRKQENEAKVQHLDFASIEERARELSALNGTKRSKRRRQNKQRAAAQARGEDEGEGEGEGDGEGDAGEGDKDSGEGKEPSGNDKAGGGEDKEESGEGKEEGGEDKPGAQGAEGK